MSLSTRIALALVVVVALFAGLDGFVVQRVFGERFQALEEHAAEADVRRVRAALSAEAEGLQGLAAGLATTEAVRRALRQAQEHGELGPQALRGLDLDLLFVLAAADERGAHAVAHATLSPLEGEAGEQAQYDELPLGSWSARHPLLAGGAGARAGIQQTEHGPLLIAIAPVEDPQGKQAEGERGHLVLGRRLSTLRIAELARRIGVEFELHQIHDGAGLPPHLEPYLALATASARGHLEPGEEHALAVVTFDDLQAQPDLLIAARLPREISRQGAAATTFGRLSVLIGALILLFALMILLRRIVLRPLEELASHAERVGRTEDLSARVHHGRTDELGRLAAELDRMLGKLAEARAALIDAARAAGKSEIATGILHNVGNVLSGIGVATEQLQEALGELPEEDLEVVVRTLEEQGADLAAFFAEDPRAGHLPPFLRALADAQRDARGRMGRELVDLRRGLEHVAQLVRDQQRFAQHGGLVEAHDARALAREALTLVERSRQSGPSPAIECPTGDALPAVKADRHRVLEILVNLVQNAQQAVEDLGPDGRVRLLLEPTPEGIALEVQDNGRGIAAEDLTRIFAPGFTTREEGHGFGLHTAANAAREMGASLTVASDGPGTGARFRLTLPIAQDAAPAPSPQATHLAA